MDAARSLVLIDTLSWPAAAMGHPTAAVIAPSLDLGAWFHRGAGDSEWLLADAEAPIAEGGMIGARARVFGRGRQLIASGGTPLLCTPMPRTET